MLEPSDLRFALRLWLRRPTLLIVAGLSLGLGIGATTTMYSLLSGVAHYRFGFAHEDRVVVFWNTEVDGVGAQSPPTYDVVQALLASGQSFEAMGLHQPAGIPVTLSGAGDTVRVSQTPVDVNGLAVTGVPPALGRTYRLDDFNDVVKEKEARGIVISDGMWQRQFAGAGDVIGKTVRVDGEPRIVIGVMPRGFVLTPGLEDVAFWAATDLRKIPYARWMMAVGRLKPGISTDAAAAEAAAISRQLLEAHGDKPGKLGANVLPIREAVFGGAEHVLTFLVGTVGFVLLIGCTNVANLLLVAGGGEAEGAGPASRHRGRPRAAPEAAHDRERAALARWRRQWHRTRGPRHPTVSAARTRGLPELPAPRLPGCARPRVRTRDLGAVERAVRMASRLARVACRPERGAQGGRADRRQWTSDAGAPCCWSPRSRCRWSCWSARA